MRPSVVRAFVFVFLIAVCAIARGQGSQPAKPDFSGTWAFDPARSNVSPKSTANAGIKISHHDPELKISMTVTINGNPQPKEFTYFSDGRGETNPATRWISTSPDGNTPHPAETKSKTKWSGDRIVTRYTLRTRMGIHISEEEIVEEWKLSADGKTLTRTTRTILPRSTPEMIVVPANRDDDKRVYKLVSK